jgi:hypothetical protein
MLILIGSFCGKSIKGLNVIIFELILCILCRMIKHLLLGLVLAVLIQNVIAPGSNNDVSTIYTPTKDMVRLSILVRFLHFI